MHVSSEHYGVSVLYSTVWLIFALKLGFLSGAAAAVAVVVPPPQVFFGSWAEKIKTELHTRISFALTHSSRSEVAFGLLHFELFSAPVDQKTEPLHEQRDPSAAFNFLD